MLWEAGIVDNYFSGALQPATWRRPRNLHGRKREPPTLTAAASLLHGNKLNDKKTEG